MKKILTIINLFFCSPKVQTGNIFNDLKWVIVTKFHNLLARHKHNI